jgi:hypothetical protein
VTVTQAQHRVREYELTGAQLAWGAVALLFLGMRLIAVFSVPVGGGELDQLSGAWQAHLHHSDERFLPTLFQAITAATFWFTTSELPARLLALLASAAALPALYLLRGRLTEAGALVAAVLLAFDPFAVLSGSTANAFALDIPLALWLFVFCGRAGVKPWQWGVSGFLAAAGGSLVLPLFIAWAGVALFRQEYPARLTFAWAAACALAAALLASLGFGFGWQGPAVAPVNSFVAGFDQRWSIETTAGIARFYGVPLLAGGAAAAVSRAYRCWFEQLWDRDSLVLLAWVGVAAAWLLVALPEQDPAPLAALAIPVALLTGPELIALFGALQRVEWRFAALPVAGIVSGLFVCEAYIVDWARIGKVGAAHDKLIVTGIVVAVIACAALLASSRRTLAALSVPLLAGAALLFFSAASNVAFGGPSEALPAPVATTQGREIRDAALAARQQSGGLIVVHPDFESDITWPFRDSGDVVLASRVPPDASVVVWPATLPAPDGYSALEGQWSFLELRRGPDGGFLAYLRWLSDRNSLRNGNVAVAVYLRTNK